MGFRYTAMREALRLGLCGWVRNLPEGDVEVWAEGNVFALADYRAWLEEGPPGARVEEVRTAPVEPAGFPSFTVEF